MVNVRAHMGDIKMTCAGTLSEVVADICCIVKAIGDGLPESDRYDYYLTLIQALQEDVFVAYSEGN